MSSHQRYRDEAETRYPTLAQFLGCYLHEDRDILYGSPEQAIEAAITEYPVELRRQVRRELVALLEQVDDDTRLRAVMNYGLGVDLYFKRPAEARSFAEHVERRLLESIKGHFEQSRMQEPRTGNSDA